MPSESESEPEINKEEDEEEEEEEEEIEEEVEEEVEEEEEEEVEEEVEEEEEEEEVEEVEEEEEESEEEEEEQELEEEEDEPVEEEEQKNEEKTLNSASDSKSEANDDDSSQEVESEGHDEDISLEKSEARSPTVVDDAHNSADPSKKPLEDISHVDDGVSNSLDLGKDSLPLEDVKLHESFSDDKVTGPQMQDDIVVESCKEKVHDGTNSSEQVQSKDIIMSTGDVKVESSCAEVAVADTQMKDRPTNGGSDSSSNSEKVTEKMDTQSGEDMKLKASSSITPQRRPRSISPAAELEAGNKRPAVICDFYARGWCIKGSACKFLHQKAGVISSSKSKQDAAHASSKDNTKDEEDPSVGNRTEPSASTDIKKPSSMSESNQVGEKTYRFLDKHLSDRMGYSSSMAEHRLQSSGSVPHSSLYGNGIDSFGYDKRVLEPPLMYASHNSPGYIRSSSHQTFPWSGTAQRPSLDGSDQGYSSSRSSLLSRHSSSPFYSRPDQNLSFRGVPGNLTTLYNWEPSVPFRPSFDFSSYISSSPGSQYDPLLDSIDPPNGKYRSSHDHSLNVASQRSNADHLQSHQPSQHAKSDETFSTHGLRASEETADQNTNNSLLKEEKQLKPSHRGKSSNAAMEVDHDPSLYNQQADGNKQNKESKTLKYFRASLVEFIKELVKPHWREGRLSKDAHNSVVKRAVEKVMGSLQPHQVPNSQELTENYLSASRTKLTKLVEGYVGKITKS